jgi:hypothetical protein
MKEEPGRDRPPEEEYVPADDTIIGTAFKWSLLVIVLVAAGIFLGLRFGGDDEEAPEVVDRGRIEAPERLVQEAAERPEVAFTDVTAEAGIDFVHTNGAVGGKLLPETMGSGAAFFDPDGDGDQDLLLLNGTHWPESDPGGRAPTMALYLNDGSGRFTDATTAWGLDVPLYGQGVAAADYDADGRVDLFVSALGGNRLFHNAGGRFEDVTASAGLAGDADRWSTSAGFFDYDNDGDLDLFVCNYVRWSRDIDLRLDFTLNGTDRAYGPPKLYEGTHSYLYRNEGGGRFTDVSAEAGIRIDNPATGKPAGKALALTFVDVDRDGRLDVFVANDTVQNFLFRNSGDGTFEEVGAASGVGFDNAGSATGAMGIDAADYGNDGGLGVGIGNFANESTSFYVQQRRPFQFVDMSAAEGIGSPSLLRLTFGLFFFDYDLDGRLDLLQTNGHLEDEINEIQPSQTYEQPAQLFWNCGRSSRGCYAAVEESRTGDLSRPIVGRGATYADIDADGDLDVLLTQAGGVPLLIRNDQDLGRHWLRVALTGSDGNRDAIGAWIELVAGGVTQRRQVMPTRSYLSQVELPVTFGLVDSDRVDALRILWPDGTTREVDVDAVDTTLRISR